MLLPACKSASAPVPARLDAGRSVSAAEGRIITRSRKCMGTACDFKAWHSDEALVDRAFTRGFEEFDRLEALMTTWRPNSEVSRINAAAGKEAVKVSPDTMAIIKKSLWVSGLTDGAFDITVGAFKGLWKFDEDKDDSLPSPAEVESRRKLVSWKDVIIDDAAGTVKLRRPGQAITLGGIAKGYAVDAAVRVIRAEGVRDFIVQAGGDLFASGSKGDLSWRVGIQDPRAPHGQIIFELPIKDRAFNTSGDYERFVFKDGVRYHHILDARTGMPARLSRSVTLLALDSFTADALDTAIFAIGPEKGMALIEQLPDLEGVIVDAHNAVTISSGLRGTLIKRRDPTDGP